jgi:hypothetical protein
MEHTTMLALNVAGLKAMAGRGRNMIEAVDILILGRRNL